MATPGLLHHGGREVDTIDALGTVDERLAHQARAAAKVEGSGEAAPGRDPVQSRDQERRCTIGEIHDEMPFEAGRVIVEEGLDVAFGHRVRCEPR